MLLFQFVRGVGVHMLVKRVAHGKNLLGRYPACHRAGNRRHNLVGLLLELFGQYLLAFQRARTLIGREPTGRVGQ